MVRTGRPSRYITPARVRRRRGSARPTWRTLPISGATASIASTCGAQGRCAARLRLASARQEPTHYFLVRIAPKFLIRIAPTAMELVLLRRLSGECRNLFFGVSFILRKGHPFANDFSARLVVFHVRGSWLISSGTAGARLRATQVSGESWSILPRPPRDVLHGSATTMEVVGVVPSRVLAVL
jgi:hypothetical protein